MGKLEKLPAAEPQVLEKIKDEVRTPSKNSAGEDIKSATWTMKLFRPI